MSGTIGTFDSDIVAAEDGNDIVYFTSGSDLLDGGAGYDTLIVNLLEPYRVAGLGIQDIRFERSTLITVSNPMPEFIEDRSVMSGFEKIIVDAPAPFQFELGNPDIKEVVTLRSSTSIRTSGNDDDFISLTHISNHTSTAYLGGYAARYDANDVQTHLVFIDAIHSIFTGDGNDQVRVISGLAPSVGLDVNLWTGNDSAVLSDVRDTASGGDGIDSILGMGGEDFIHGGNGDDALYGGDGDDLLIGDDPNVENGDDQLFGDAGNDRIEGSRGADRMYGGTGADTIISGSGGLNSFGDYADGGTGNDTITFSAGFFRDRAYFDQSGNANADLVNGFRARDFLGAAEDRVLLENTGFIASLTEGQIDAANFRSRPNDARALDGNDYFIFNRANDTLWFDRDGSRALYSAQLICDFSNDVNLTAANLFIV